MREIVLDTETTGMDPADGHRMIEIGCVELVNHVPSGKTLQLYINPERDVPADAVAVHGLTDQFLADKPVFAEVYSEFLEFVKDARLVIHNAEFDMRFINHELGLVGHPEIPMKHVVDTLAMARQRFPGSPANLDALCRRFGIDNTERTYHGALLDSELLAEVYLELLGGRQHGLSFFAKQSASKDTKDAKTSLIKERPVREPRQFAISSEEEAAHRTLLEGLDDPLWTKLEKSGQASGQ